MHITHPNMSLALRLDGLMAWRAGLRQVGACLALAEWIELLMAIWCLPERMWSHELELLNVCLPTEWQLHCELHPMLLATVVVLWSQLDPARGEDAPAPRHFGRWWCECLACVVEEPWAEAWSEELETIWARSSESPQRLLALFTSPQGVAHASALFYQLCALDLGAEAMCVGQGMVLRLPLPWAA